MCSARMKEGKIIAPNRLVENCPLYLVCIAWRLELQKVQNWIWFSGKWETWTLWEEQSSVRSLGKALAWWLPKVCASICCQVLRPVFSIWCTCWFWVLNLHNISNIFPLSPSVEFLILQFSKLFFTSELILSTFTVVKQSLFSTFRAYSRKSGSCWTATAGPWPSHGQVDDTFVFNVNNENQENLRRWKNHDYHHYSTLPPIGRPCSRPLAVIGVRWVLPSCNLTVMWLALVL